MSPMQWLLIILVVLIIAAIAFMLTRRPSNGRGSSTQQTQQSPANPDSHGPGGSHVAAGDAGAVDEQPGAASDDQPFDQEAPAATPGAHDPAASQDQAPEGEPGDAQASYVDTASGEEVYVGEATGEDPEPVVEQPDVEREEPREEASSPIEEQEAEQEAAARSVTFGEPSPVAEETTYAAPPVYDEADSTQDAQFQEVERHEQTEPSEPAATDPAPAWMAEEQVADERDHEEASHDEPAPAASAAPTVVPPSHTEWEDDADDVPADAQEAGFVESSSLASDPVEFHDAPAQADTATADGQAPAGNADEPTPLFDAAEVDPPSVEPAGADNEIAEGPYGPGSALPGEDGSQPMGFAVKGNQGSMLFHTPESPNFDGSRGDVWFDSEESAKAAGFVHWDRKRR